MIIMEIKMWVDQTFINHAWYIPAGVKLRIPLYIVLDSGFLCPECGKWFSYAEVRKEVKRNKRRKYND